MSNFHDFFNRSDAMILLDQKRINRTLQRMAIQIVEAARGANICMVGLNERGYAIAMKMNSSIENETGRDVPLYPLSSDDDSPFQFKEPVREQEILVVVDDVIFSGETMQRAINKIPELSRFEKIYIAVLVDRGHRKYPIYAGIVGAHVPTKLNEEVEVQLNQEMPENVILITK